LYAFDNIVTQESRIRIQFHIGKTDALNDPDAPTNEAMPESMKMMLIAAPLHPIAARGGEVARLDWRQCWTDARRRSDLYASVIARGTVLLRCLSPTSLSLSPLRCDA
jgi:hypothetical protein